MIDNSGNIVYNGRNYSPKQWFDIQLAIAVSEANWRKTEAELLERMKQVPLPDLIINGKSWREWKPSLKGGGDD